MDVVEKSLEELEREITCAICQDHYTQPKVLPCLHYYCEQCIYKVSLRTGTDKPFSCPECRKEAILPDGSVDQLPTAFFVNRLKTTYSTLERAHGKVEVKCEACTDSAANAEAFCRQCAVFICKRCVKSHQRLKKIFDGHEVISFQELKEENADNVVMKEHSSTKCPIHKEPLMIYCFDCSTLICRDCTVKNHRDHKFEFSAIEAPKLKEKLMKQLVPLREANGSLSHAVEEIQANKCELEAHMDSVTSTIKISFQELYTILESCEQELLDDAEEKIQNKITKLSDQMKSLTITRSEIQSVLDYTEQCMRHCGSNEVMCMHTEIESRIKVKLEEHCKPGRSMEPVEEVDVGVEIQCAEALKHLCNTKAKITQLPVNSVIGELASEIEVNETAVVSLRTTKLLNNKPTKRSIKIDSHLKSLYNESIIQCNVERVKGGEYLIQFTPTIRGRHELTIQVDEQQVSGSPFPLFVSISPTELSKPVHAWSGMKQPSDVNVNSMGELIVTEFSGDILIFDQEGNRLRSINRSEHQFQKLNGSAVDSEDNIYSAGPLTNKLFKSHPNSGIIQAKVAKQENGPGHRSVAVVGNEVMVCEQSNKSSITVYDRQLNFVRRIAGRDIGSFIDIAPDSDGNLYVTCWANSCVQVFNNDGKFLRSFGCDDIEGKNSMSPRYLCVVNQFVYVIDNRDTEVSVFSTEGEYVTSFGQGDFIIPHGVCVDQDGFVYVCDFSSSKVVVF